MALTARYVPPIIDCQCLDEGCKAEGCKVQRLLDAIAKTALPMPSSAHIESRRTLGSPGGKARFGKLRVTRR